MKPFHITIRTSAGRTSYTALARTSCDAWQGAADTQGDTPCAITVTAARAV